MESKKKKHSHPQKGYDTKGLMSAVEQHEIVMGKLRGVVYLPHPKNQNGGNWYFRHWVSSEQKQIKKSLRTTDKETALQLGEDELLGIVTKQRQGHKVFGLSVSELCEEWLSHKEQEVQTNRIKWSRYETLRTQVRRWIVPYLNSVVPNQKISNISKNTGVEYGMYRRQRTNNKVDDVTIRNEYTTVNAIIKYAWRNDYLPFEKLNVEDITIRGDDIKRRETFSPEEYRLFYQRLGKWVRDARDEHEVYMRTVLYNYCLLLANTLTRPSELRQIKWGMTKVLKVKTDDGNTEQLVGLNLPAEITKNNRHRDVITRGGHYLQRIRKISEFTKDDDFVFVNRTNGKNLTKSTFDKYWRHIRDATSIEHITGKTLTYYSFRHWCITARLMSRIPHYEVAKMAGTSVRYIERNYDHMDMDKMRDNALKTFKLDGNGFRLREE